MTTQPVAPQAPEPVADSPQPSPDAARLFRRAVVLALVALGCEAFTNGPLAVLRLPEVLWYVGAAALPPGLICATVAGVLARTLRFEQRWQPRVVRALLRAGWTHLALVVGAEVVGTQPTEATVWLVVLVAAVAPEGLRLLWGDLEKFDRDRYRQLKRQGRKWPG